MVGLTTIVVFVLLFAIHVHLKNEHVRDNDPELKRARNGVILPRSHSPEVLPQFIKCPETSNSNQDSNVKFSGSDAENRAIKEKLIKLANLVAKAKKHVRGTKTGDALFETVAALDDVMHSFDLDFKSATKRRIVQSKNICPESYNGTTFGYPFFYKGFERTSCSFGKPEDQLVTVVFIYNREQTYNLLNVLEGIKTYNKRLSVIVGIYDDSKFFETSFSKFSTVKVEKFDRSVTNGHIWNSLLNSVKTDYVLIAHDIMEFNEDARLDRLIREMERLNLKVAGGATRNKDGFWKLGCHQRAYKNYSLTYLEGYDESVHECIFCDHVDGPFIIKTEDVLRTKFDDTISNMGLFEDFFLRISGESAVCADSMFYVNTTERSSSTDMWDSLARKLSLRRLKFSSGIDISFKCPSSYECFGGTGFVVTPCCLQELADMVNFIMKSCEEKGIICELQEGTLLGAVKLHKVLPWERDADLTFLTANYSVFQRLETNFRSAGYSYSDGASLWCCADNRTAGGKFKVASTHWHVELYGQHLMDTEMLVEKKIKPTKVPFDGRWVNTPRNPGWHARNRYGHEIYAHSQHWLSTGKSSGWIHYQTNMFTKCYSPGRHNCLDRFNADGNLPFGDPIP